MEIQNADNIRSMAEEERKRKREETREARNKEAENCQWLMLQHYLECECGPCSDEAKIMLKRVLTRVKEYSDDPNIDVMSIEERGFWFMLNAVFRCIDPAWLIDNEIDYQLEKILGEENADAFRSKTSIDQRIEFLDEHLVSSWRAIQYEYPSYKPLDVEPEILERFLRGQEAIKEVVEGNWVGDGD